jgi:shikimate kinase
MNIVLIGYRGTGKTTVAQLVALQLGREWIDADVEIELRAGKSIAAVFAEDGENHFRDLESEVLAELLQKNDVVLALGGGVIVRESNRELIKNSGSITVWLTAPANVLHERILADALSKERRPALTNQSGLEEIRTLLMKREPWYRECTTIAIDNDQKSPGRIADEIVQYVRSTDH